MPSAKKYQIMPITTAAPGEEGTRGALFTRFTCCSVGPSLPIYHLPLALEEYKRNLTLCQRTF